MAADIAVAVHSSPAPVGAPSPTGSSSSASSTGPQAATVNTSSLQTSNNDNVQQPAATFPPPKTDKPRPHVCTTCQRSFARLEHLKRHERSHTKEKPFECTECTRCFARRDLLLRHQQKLHQTTTPSARPRGRRESTSSLAGNPSKVRKNSSTSNTNANSGANGVRPRANTISHIDGGTLGMLAAANRSANNASNGNVQIQQQQNGVFEQPRGMSAAQGHRSVAPALPRLATTGHSMDIGSGLRTAPPVQNMGSFSFDNFSFGSTINPAQLHMHNPAAFQSSPFGAPGSPFTPQPAILEDDDRLEWIPEFNQMSFNGPNGGHLQGSPPQHPTQTPAHALNFSENQFGHGIGMQDHGLGWQDNTMPQNGHDANHMQLDMVQNFQGMEGITHTISPDPLQHTSGMPADNMYNNPPSLSPNSVFSTLPGQLNPHPALSNDGTSVSSLTNSAHLSSATSLSTDSITDATRTALLLTLSQPSVFGSNHRKYSQPTISSPLSPQTSAMPKSGFQSNLPSTQDLQRFVAAYIQYFHPHFPFLHIATLQFDTPHYTSNIRHAAGSSSDIAHGGIIGGGGCLVLAMAAIGALYEFDRQASKELFEASKKMIQLYLEERRKADMATAAKSPHGNVGDLAAQNTPLWLVQAMLLNVIYGHNCGDKMAGDIASTHCTALVSLARAAELTKPHMEAQKSMSFGTRDVQMDGMPDFNDPWSDTSGHDADEQRQWRLWIGEEERKRTVFAIFHMSCLLVASYNHPPALMNSEIQLDLPCDEELWAAPTPHIWATKRTGLRNCHDPLPFSHALSELLSAGQKQTSPMPFNRPFGSGVPREDVPKSDLRPSTFGCLVLIDALHNYIWETRQRHSGRTWTTQETESMHAHIEPALRAWQSAWASNPTHSLERPNPHGLGPLSADSIPLLDLAYVRLFVNLGTTKEALWQRDFDRMTEEFARGQDIVQHAENADLQAVRSDSSSESRNSPDSTSSGPVDLKIPRTPENSVVPPLSIGSEQTDKRERLLRKAAFYAADSLSMSDKLGVTFADFTSRELPVQSVICAFDCAQILAEWVSTVQERVGQYIGILGQANVDYSQVPAILLLGEEDCKLLVKVSEILQKTEQKMAGELSQMNPASPAAVAMMKALPRNNQGGFGSKILRIAAWHLQRAAVWPITNVIADGLLIQAEHVQQRAAASLSAN